MASTTLGTDEIDLFRIGVQVEVDELLTTATELAEASLDPQREAYVDREVDSIHQAAIALQLIVRSITLRQHGRRPKLRVVK